MDILDLVHTHDLQYKTTRTGIYINIATVPDETIQILMDIAGHFENQKRLREKPRNSN